LELRGNSSLQAKSYQKDQKEKSPRADGPQQNERISDGSKEATSSLKDFENYAGVRQGTIKAGL
jgi:hypothetical protein